MIPLKIFPHFQRITPWAKDFVNTRRLAYCKQIFYGNDYEDLFPYSNTIARHFIVDGDRSGDRAEETYIKGGYDGGVAYFHRLLPAYKALRGKVLAHEGPNEPSVKDLTTCSMLSEFYRGWITSMRNYGFRTVSGNFSNGTPDVNDPQILRALGWAFMGTYLGLHQYGWTNMQTGASWLALRHRMLISKRKEIGLGVNRILLTECGEDATQIGMGGYKSTNGWSAYLNELLWFNQELSKDWIVAGGFLFNSGGWGIQWDSFELDDYQWNLLYGAPTILTRDRPYDMDLLRSIITDEEYKRQYYGSFYRADKETNVRT